MKHSHILYLHKEKDANFSAETGRYLQKVLSSRYFVQLYRIGKDNEKILTARVWNLVILQDTASEIWQLPIFRKLKKYPFLFISTLQDIRGYIVPFSNLAGVINLSGANLSAYGIPQEMQIRLNKPIEKKSNFYFFEQKPELCQIVFCPTEHGVKQNILKLITSLYLTNTELTVISDEYLFLQNILPAFVKIAPRTTWFSSFKKAHLIIASGYEAIQAMALCKPCVILGDYGLGGFVTQENYNNLQTVSFQGRKGAYFGEMIPHDLLEIEIKKVLTSDNREEVNAIQKCIISSYNPITFKKTLCHEVERIIKLSNEIKRKKGRMSLKPFVSSTLSIEEINEKKYIIRGISNLGEIETGMANLLEQCDGSSTIRELIDCNGYEEEDVSILWENLFELWNEKMLLFKL